MDLSRDEQLMALALDEAKRLHSLVKRRSERF